MRNEMKARFKCVPFERSCAPFDVIYAEWNGPVANKNLVGFGRRNSPTKHTSVTQSLSHARRPSVGDILKPRRSSKHVGATISGILMQMA